jgi:predicted alpha-1,2-mannosidase
LSRGYVPIDDVNETGASVTLEYASADFAISRLAAALGHDADAARLLRSAQNWRKLFDAESGLIRPRWTNGKFLENWDPLLLLPHRVRWDQSSQLGFEEGSSWQYTWMIPHNYGGLFEAMGGADKAVEKLDKLFEKVNGWGEPHFTVANEPNFCSPYAYLWAGEPWKTQSVVARIRETFTTQPDGIPGNDDLGATSGVYWWSALGLYPVIPGVGGFALGTPLFPRTTLRLGDDRTLEILARGEGIYVQSVTLNGQPCDSAWLPLDALSAKDNHLEFSLGTEPNKAWGANRASFPPSFDAAVE